VNFAVKCLLGLAVLASPCAWDTDPRNAWALSGLQEQLTSQNGSQPSDVDNPRFAVSGASGK